MAGLASGSMYVASATGVCGQYWGIMIQPIGMPDCISEFWREEREEESQKKKGWVWNWIRKMCCLAGR